MPPALLIAVGGGAVSAAMYLTVLLGSTGGMILVYLAPLPLFLAGMALGTQAALIATGVATLAITAAIGNVVLPMTFLVFLGVPVLLVVRQGQLTRHRTDGTIEWYPPGHLLVLLTGLGLAAILVATAAMAAFGNDGGLKTVIRGLLVDSLVELFSNSGLPEPTNPGSAAADIVAEVFPGVVAVSWLMMIIVNGLLAQSLLARFNRLMRPPLHMSEMTLPRWLPLVLAGIVIGAMTLDGQLGFVFVNLSIVMMVPFLFAGLGVVHAFAASRPSKVAILFSFYLIVSLLAWPVLAVIGLGIIEQWAGLSRRFAAGGPDRGEA